MTRIVICCDGTWDRRKAAGGKDGRTTNVSRFYDAVKGRPGQVAWHDDGIGANGGPLRRLIAGATGYGLGKNVRQGYREICSQYRGEDDQIYLFGFSRGAYTARSIAGMVRNVGIIDKPSWWRVLRAYWFYRNKHHPDCPTSDHFRDQMGSIEAPIHFLGVWDTVGSLGIPVGRLRKWGLRLNDFHDVRLSSRVHNAYQAVAIDEARGPFSPTLWSAPERKKPLEQAWFVGYHRDVGGGAEHDGASNVTLEWVAEKARACDLDVGGLPAPDPDAPLHDSMDDRWSQFGTHVRNIGDPRFPPQTVHDSVRQRQGSIGYHAAGLVEFDLHGSQERGDGPLQARECPDLPDGQPIPQGTASAFRAG